MKNLLFISIFFFPLLGFTQQTTSLELVIQNPKSNKGSIQVLIFNSEQGFPSDPKKAFMALTLPITNFSAQKILDNLPPGKYAISVFHDEDGDGQMQKNNLGIPLDRYGFSNNPTLYFGPPSFIKCAVPTKNIRQKIEIKLR